MELTRKIIIAIDGYSSCGKSTLAKALARHLSYVFIDSGSMYRAVTWCLLNQNFKPEEVQAMPHALLKMLLDDIHISFSVNPDTGLSEVYLNGQMVESLIRTLQVSDQVSAISAIPEIRHRMVALQQSYGRDKGIVMDGRDIGTTVFPNAELKLFMTANNEVRARRRFDELKAKGYSVTMEEVYRNIEERDYADTHRSESPLRQAEDAIVLDNSNLNEQEQLDFALNELSKLQDVS